MKQSDILLMEEHEPDGVHWGISFDGFNPELESYVECKDKDNASKLQDLIKSILPTSSEATA